MQYPRVFFAIIALLAACGDDQSSTPGPQPPPAPVPTPVHQISMGPSTATVTELRTLKLSAVPLDSLGRALTAVPVLWQSNATAIATVDPAGNVLGRVPGQAVITASAGGKQAQLTVTVVAAPVATVVISPETATVLQGATVSFTVTVRSDQGHVLSGRQIRWRSSSSDIARVDSITGSVMGLKAGSAVITATSEGKTGTATVNVVVPVATVEVIPALDTIEVADSVVQVALTRDVDGNVLTGRTIRWTSSNSAVATIDSITGALIGRDRGTVTITASSEGKSGTATRVVVIRYRSIAAGAMHACDIASGGVAWCWGLNGGQGRIGMPQLGDDMMSATPVKVPGNHQFTQVVSFGRHSCAIDRGGAAWCWGYNGWGELGSGQHIGQSATPVRVSGNRVYSRLAAGTDHACGLEVGSGAIWCWGNSDWRQLGTGQGGMSNVPVAVAGGGAHRSIAAGGSHTCSVMLTGEARCWGANSIGQVGDGGPISYGNSFVALPHPVAGGRQFATITTGNQYSCGILTNGQGWCWGSNNGKLGNGGVADASTPQAMTGGHLWRTLSAGALHACGVTTSDDIYCWGANGFGQLGNGIANASTTPVRAGGNLKAAEVAAAGIGTGSAGFTCAISADRLTTWCWGRNDTGQLGNGATAPAASFNPVPTIVVGQKPL